MRERRDNLINVVENPYKSIVVIDQKGNNVTISEGNNVQFVTEQGEIKTGNVTKLIGKEEKLKVQILPQGKEYEEIWSITTMKDGTLILVGEQ